MSSFQKFVNFLDNDAWSFTLSEDEIEGLHSFLFQTSEDKIVDAGTISRYLKIPHRKGLLVLKALIASEILVAQPLHCTTCGEEIADELASHCWSCGSQLDEGYIVSAKLSGILSEDDKRDLKSRKVNQRRAEMIAASWEKNGFISYILLDLVQSELVQLEGDDIYKRTLDVVREIVFRFALDKVSGQYLLLGEVGDCFKIAFTKPEDVLRFFSEFSKKLIEKIESGQFPSLKRPGIYFPCFNAVANTVSLPIDSFKQKMKPQSLIFTTLSGAIDFNSLSLTSLFRLDSKIKLDYEQAFSQSNICLWLFEELGEKLQVQPSETVTFTVGKHKEAAVSKKASLWVFTGKTLTPISTPSRYLKEVSLYEDET